MQTRRIWLSELTINGAVKQSSNTKRNDFQHRRADSFLSKRITLGQAMSSVRCPAGVGSRAWGVAERKEDLVTIRSAAWERLTTGCADKDPGQHESRGRLLHISGARSAAQSFFGPPYPRRMFPIDRAARLVSRFWHEAISDWPMVPWNSRTRNVQVRSRHESTPLLPRIVACRVQVIHLVLY